MSRKHNVNLLKNSDSHFPTSLCLAKKYDTFLVLFHLAQVWHGKHNVNLLKNSNITVFLTWSQSSKTSSGTTPHYKTNKINTTGQLSNSFRDLKNTIIPWYDHGIHQDHTECKENELNKEWENKKSSIQRRLPKQNTKIWLSKETINESNVIHTVKFSKALLKRSRSSCISFSSPP